MYLKNKKIAVLPVDTITVRQFEGGVTPTYALQFTKGISSPVKFQIDVVFVAGYIQYILWMKKVPF